MEIYKNIQGYENLYQISNMGNVKSLNKRKGRILKPTKNYKGYLYVDLWKQGEKKLHYIHRLVAQAFIPNPDNLPEVNHKDEDKTNNNVTNLEFCDRKHNINYGTRNKKVGEKLSKQVLCVETGKIYPSTHQVERELGFVQGNISSACTGRYKQAYGYTWRYV